MGKDIMDLIKHLRLEGPYDEYRLPRASDENAPPPGDEFADEREASDKGDSESEPMEEDNPRWSLWRRDLARVERK